MVERQIVALEGVGSTPIIHPIFLYLLPDGVGASPSGKARDFDSRIRKVRILPPQPRIELKTSCTLRTRGFCFILEGIVRLRGETWTLRNRLFLDIITDRNQNIVKQAMYILLRRIRKIEKRRGKKLIFLLILLLTIPESTE